MTGPDGRGTQVVNGTGVMAGSTTYKELESAYTTVKGMLDTASNTQQMDMIRLQAASNKRNEAFEVMTNTEKRRSDLNSSITSNMR
ncbi:secreted protein [Bordetella pertussis]|nr:secreted protein [Bordetella pertussis]CFO74813.1 secreted protein [Bordetella pertussis]CPI19462.1 secreted protein [Bordetella pertussis]CPK83480.1 secreted protein [Bordetella pertussis]CPM04797.1 secreted protein [Bordetella pertussis]